MKTLIAVALLLPLPVMAQQYYPPPQQYQQPPQQYQQPPQQYQPQGDVQRLSTELLRATDRLDNLADQELYHPNQMEADAINHLRHLRNAAQQFESDVYQFGPQSPQARSDFDRVVRIYGRTANRVDQLQDEPDIYRSFGRVQHAMDRLTPYYGGYQRWGYRYQGHGYKMNGPDLQIGIGGFHIGIGH